MRIEFDVEKDKTNQDKHGALAFASELDWKNSLVWLDTRMDYGEVRMIALAPTPSTGILYYVAFVDRSVSRRIIRLRKANRHEVKHYVKSS